MLSERKILNVTLLMGVGLLPILFKKPGIKKWSVIHIANGITSHLIDGYLVKAKRLQYPIRLAPKIFKINILYDYLICPLISILYCQSSYNSGLVSTIGKAFLFATPQIAIEYLAEKKTKLIKYRNGWTWIHSYLGIVAVKLTFRCLFELLKPKEYDSHEKQPIVGRRVLMYLSEPKRVIAELSALLKVGGLMIFQEHDSTMSPGSVVPMPLHKQVNKWIWDTVEREGGNIHIGFDLWSLLAQKGLVVEKVSAEAVVQTPDAPYPMAPIVRVMLHRLIEKGVATEDEIDINTLEYRLAEECEKSKATYIREMVFCAWARKIE